VTKLNTIQKETFSLLGWLSKTVSTAPNGRHLNVIRVSNEPRLGVITQVTGTKKDSIPSAALSTTTDCYQPFGSMPSRSNSLRPSVLSQLAKLIPAAEAASSNCVFNSGVIRILNCGDCPSPLGLLSRFIIDRWSPIKLVSLSIGGHLSTMKPMKATPQTVEAALRRLTTTDSNNIEEAALNNTTLPYGQYLYIWRFYSCQQSRVFTVTARTEPEARSLLPDAPCLFAARICTGGINEQ